MTSVAVEYYRLRIILFSNRIHFDLSQQTEKRSQIVYNKIKFLRSRYMLKPDRFLHNTSAKLGSSSTNKRTNKSTNNVYRQVGESSRTTYLFAGPHLATKALGPRKAAAPRKPLIWPGMGARGRSPDRSPPAVGFREPEPGSQLLILTLALNSADRISRDKFYPLGLRFSKARFE